MSAPDASQAGAPTPATLSPGLVPILRVEHLSMRFGGLVAIMTLGAAVRRKGLVRGVAHSALDAVPFVGGVKNAAEAVRGRDFFRDRDLPAVTR